MTNRRAWTTAVFLFASALATSASADPTQSEDRYGYVFKDDVLAAGGGALSAAPIVVQKHLRREVLLRPRVQFITAMLKSVEGL